MRGRGRAVDLLRAIERAARNGAFVEITDGQFAQVFRLISSTALARKTR